MKIKILNINIRGVKDLILLLDNSKRTQLMDFKILYHKIKERIKLIILQ